MVAEILSAITAIAKFPDKMDQLIGTLRGFKAAMDHRNNLEFMKQTHILNQKMKSMTSEDDYAKALSDLTHLHNKL